MRSPIAPRALAKANTGHAVTSYMNAWRSALRHPAAAAPRSDPQNGSSGFPRIA
jgi:hypothetical protein